MEPGLLGVSVQCLLTGWIRVFERVQNLRPGLTCQRNADTTVLWMLSESRRGCKALACVESSGLRLHACG
jgi:hypothetical protein